MCWRLACALGALGVLLAQAQPDAGPAAGAMPPDADADADAANPDRAGGRAMSLGDRGGGDGGDSAGLGALYALLAQHGALGGHALARKSVRSPSRRLRFGRRYDPALPPKPPLQDADEDVWVPWAQGEHRLVARAPLRLRFGRAGAWAPPDQGGELLVPHVFPDDLPQEEERELRSPSMRLRFGRSGGGDELLP